jgi:hypothetical protein
MTKRKIRLSTTDSSTALSTTDSGTAFEQQLAQYYEALGFRVTRNQLLSGHQVDLLASKDVPGAGVVSVMIEAKYRSKGAVGINEISNSISAALSLLSSQKINSASIISNTGFTAEAKSAVADRPNIQLATLHDLQQQLFNSSESLLRSLQDFSTDRISTEYIGLSATSYSGKKSVKDVADHIYYNCALGGTLLILLGDFGSGKSTVLERVFVECAKQRLRDATARFPVFLRLRSLRQHVDLWSFVSTNLRDQQYITPPKHVFDSQLQLGRLIVFLDGFDEIYAGASLTDRVNYLTLLYPLLNSMSPCVLSSRPTYFSSPQEMLRVLSLRVGQEKEVDRTPVDAKTRAALGKLRQSMGLGGARRVTAELFDDMWAIDQLSEEAILTYLTQQETLLKGVTGKSAVEIRGVLDRVYDLKDLMRRPLLLKMVVQTILDDVIDINKPDLAIGPSTLYETYTQLTFERDEKRGAGSLSADARRVVCQHLSLAMTKSGSTELSYDEVRECILRSGINSGDVSPGRSAAAYDGRRSQQHPPNESAIESILTDIRLGSFLVFGREGTLRFAHKSYLEFFAAQFIYQCALDNADALSRVGELKLGREVVYFLGSYARGFPAFAQWLSLRAESRPPDSALSRADALRAMFASGVLLSGARVVDATISDVELRRAKVTYAQLEKIVFRDVVVSDLEAQSWSFSRSVLENCEIATVTFQDSDVELEVRNSSLAGIQVKGGTFAIEGKGWALDASVFRNTDVQLRGTGAIGQVRFEKCSLRLMMESRGEPRFEASDCTATFKWDAEPFKLDGVKIRNSLIFGLVLSLEDALSLVLSRSATSKDLPDVDTIDATNTGIVFIDPRRVNESLVRQWENAKGAIETKFSKLLFFDLELYQQAILMPQNRKKSALRRINKAARGTRESGAPKGTASNDVEAISLTLRLSQEIKNRSWINNGGAGPLVAELKASGFI